MSWTAVESRRLTWAAALMCMLALGVASQPARATPPRHGRPRSRMHGVPRRVHCTHTAKGGVYGTVPATSDLTASRNSARSIGQPRIS